MSSLVRKLPLAGLKANLALFILLPLALNGVIFGLDRDRPRRQIPGIPPGWVVGSIWIALFAAMGTSRWLLLRGAIFRSRRQRAESVSLLALLCLLYPLYTRDFRDDRIGLAGNVLTAGVAIPVTVSAWRRSRVSGGCVAAVCGWLLYAAGATACSVVRKCTPDRIGLC